jgi:hypothetical protein
MQTEPLSLGSDRSSKLKERGRRSGRGRCVEGKVVGTAAEVPHERVANDYHLCGAIRLPPTHRPEAARQLGVIGLDRVVRVARDGVPGRGGQLVQHAELDGRGADARERRPAQLRRPP